MLVIFCGMNIFFKLQLTNILYDILPNYFLRIPCSTSSRSPTSGQLSSSGSMGPGCSLLVLARWPCMSRRTTGSASLARTWSLSTWPSPMLAPTHVSLTQMMSRLWLCLILCKYWVSKKMWSFLQSFSLEILVK